MTIVFKIDEFLFELFPDLRSETNDVIFKKLEEHYTIEGVRPKVKIDGKWISIEINEAEVQSQASEFQKVTRLCEQGKYNAAKPILTKLIDKNSTNSEYHRVLGQIHSEEGDQEAAIDSLIDALRWNPKNIWALIMMGNIFSKFKKDIDTALTYYNQVLALKPDDHITLSNIGANLMQLGKTDDALVYFDKALKANPNYPNTHYALGLANEMRGDYQKAFDCALEAVANNPKNDGLLGKSIKLAIESAQSLTQKNDGKEQVEKFALALENKCGKTIKIEVDEQIPTAAKIEFAENYDRDFHLVKYKSSYPAVEHLVIHELMHLELVTEARATSSNQLFTSNPSNKSKFTFSIESFADKLKKRGVDAESIANFFQALFNGINSQIYNTPIDLFIEDRIFNRFPELRAYQFLSLFALIQEGIQANTKPEIVQNTPKAILSKSKILNLINAIHFKELYKVDLIQDHKPTKLELNQANELYKEFLEYRDDKEPGEEYELVQHWAEDLKLDAYFNLIPEDTQNRKSIDDVVKEIEEDPYGLKENDTSKERKMKKFLDAHSSSEINNAVAMYMVAALGFFKAMPKEKVKEIAFEFATLGMTGIDPNKDGYAVPSISDKTFSGYQALAYYYVSWAIAIPEMLAQLQMPFDKEYDLAKQMTEL